MPYKTDFPPFPYLDPEFNPDHPIHHMSPLKEDPYLPLSPREKKKLEREALEHAIANWIPPHVPRSWETDTDRAVARQEIMRMTLSPKWVEEDELLLPKSANDSSPSRKLNRQMQEVDQSRTSFRRFAARRLHLGYNRFHASHGEPELPSEEFDPDIAETDICWIMEYTVNECNTIRRKIGLLIGEFPAVADEFNPAYDAEIAWRYERRLYCRCRRRNKRCVRPSHIEVFTSTGDVLP